MLMTIGSMINVMRPLENYSGTEENQFTETYLHEGYSVPSPGTQCCEVRFDSTVQELDYGILAHDVVLVDLETMVVSLKIEPGKRYMPRVWTVNPGTTSKKIMYDVFVGNIKVASFDSGDFLLPPHFGTWRPLPSFLSDNVLVPSNPNPQLCVVIK